VVQVSDDTGSLELVFFRGLHYLKQALSPGKRISIAGPVTHFRVFQIVHPEWKNLRKVRTLAEAFFLSTRRPKTWKKHGLITNSCSASLWKTLEKFTFSDPLTPEERTYLGGLHSEISVLIILHNPSTLAEVGRPCRRSNCGTVAALSEAHDCQKDRIGKGRVFPAQPEAEKAMRGALPFTLTQGQEQVLLQLGEALERSAQFAGLLQGDVGSGKTVVVLLAACAFWVRMRKRPFLSPRKSWRCSTSARWLRCWRGRVQSDIVDGINFGRRTQQHY